MVQMTEAEFIAKIDCRFPYQDRHAALELIREAVSLTPNCVFAIVDEIVRPPASVAVSRSEKNELLNIIASAFEHPLKICVLGISYKIVAGHLPSSTELLALMDEIGRHPNQYSALSIVYFAIDDEQGELEAKYQFIIEKWKSI